jgi:hypothetical protein
MGAIMLILLSCQAKQPRIETVEPSAPSRRENGQALATEPQVPQTGEDGGLESAAPEPAPTDASDETANPSEKLTEMDFSEFSAIAIAKSKEVDAKDITEEEIREMVDKALYSTDEFRNLISNGQTVVIKPNLVQMIVDSTGERLDQMVNGITADWRVAKVLIENVRMLNPDGKIYVMEGSATGRTKDVTEYFNYTP